jgi:hypothetical protein
MAQPYVGEIRMFAGNFASSNEWVELGISASNNMLAIVAGDATGSVRVKVRCVVRHQS